MESYVYFSNLKLIKDWPCTYSTYCIRQSAPASVTLVLFVSLIFSAAPVITTEVPPDMGPYEGKTDVMTRTAYRKVWVPDWSGNTVPAPLLIWTVT